MINLKNRFQPEKHIIGFNELRKLNFQVGTVKNASLLSKSKKPTYEMDSDFGISKKKSCGQFVRNYKIDELMDKQVLSLTNLSPVRIAGIKSEYLTLGFSDELNDGQAIAISPLELIQNGSKLFYGNLDDTVSNVEIAKYEDFQSIEIRSGTIIDIIKDFKGDNLFTLVDIGNENYTFAYIPGKLIKDKSSYIGIQVPVIVNIEIPFLTQFFDFKSMIMCVSLEDEKEPVTMLKIDKPVKNGLHIF